MDLPNILSYEALCLSSVSFPDLYILQIDNRQKMRKWMDDSAIWNVRTCEKKTMFQ